jgi:MerR family mercuric resistance operon transcriptional regulator
MNEELTIGKLATKANVNVETVRFYERKGLLVKPQKRGSFRYYSTEYVTKIKFIKKVQELGFTLKEAGELMSLDGGLGDTCSNVTERIEIKVDEINNKMKDLKKMKKSLKLLLSCCDEGYKDADICPIVECFLK